MQRYVLAVRRNRVVAIGPDWHKRLRSIRGVRVQETSTTRALVDADEVGLALMRRIFGHDVLIQPLVRRRPA